MSYHLSGIISAALFLLTALGFWVQIKLIWKRKRDFEQGILTTESISEALSLKRFWTAFLGFYSFMVYGFCLEYFNHYLVWTRLIACLLVVVIVYEIYRDRRDRESTIVFWGCSLATILSLVLMVGMRDLAVDLKSYSAILILVVTALLAYGYVNQVSIIWKLRRTGAVSVHSHQLILAKDISTIVFAIAMGLHNGWPILVLCSVSATNQLAVIWSWYTVRRLNAATKVSTVT